MEAKSIAFWESHALPKLPRCRSQQAAHARAVSDGVTDGRAPALRRAAARDGASKEKSVKMGLMAPRGQEDKFRGAGGARRQTKCQFVDGWVL